VIEGLLGKGGMGAVYRARDTRLGNKLWAVKEMSTAGLSTSEEFRQGVEAFRREATMLARLNHRHLPKVIDNFEEGGREYLVMELVEGQTLAAMVTKGSKPLRVEQVIGWSEQLCDVLGYLHSQRPAIIFRDLKPDNIMVDKDGVVKLIDFGIARHFKPGKQADTTAFGTTGYAPPEQYGKGQTDARSDVYALAATLHQLLTQRDPSQDPFNFPPARQLNPNVPEGLSVALQRALSHSPADRWANMADFRRALQTPAQPSPDLAPVGMPVAFPARPASSVAPPTPVAPPQRVPSATANTVDRHRAGWLAYLIVVGGLAAASVLFHSPDLFVSLQELTGDGALSNLLYLMLIWTAPVLAYLLTRRPLAAFLVFSIGWWLGVLGSITDLGDEMLQNALITAGVLEATFLLSGYRTRGVLVGIVAAVFGAIAGIALLIIRNQYAPSTGDLVVALLAGLVGGALAALLAAISGRG
jgi:serine/threonine-protein kinase